MDGGMKDTLPHTIWMKAPQVGIVRLFAVFTAIPLLADVAMHVLNSAATVTRCRCAH